MRTDTGFFRASNKNTIPLLMTLFLVIFTVGCDRDHGTALVTPVNSAPTVVYTIPADEDTGVPLNRKISVAFSEEMTAATVTDAAVFTVTGPGTTTVTAVTISYDEASNIALFTPDSNLAPNTTYTGTITVGALNAAGTAMVNSYVWTFTTGLVTDATAPLLLSTAPANSLMNVPVDVTITATFNEPIDPLTITPLTYTVTGPTGSVISAISGSVTYFGNIATFNPTNDLDSNATYTVEIAASDLAGNAWLIGNVPNPWHFTTGSASVINLGILDPFGIASYGGLTDTGATKINGDVVLHTTYTCNGDPILFSAGPGFGTCGGNILNIPTNNAGDLVITSVYPDTTTAPAVMTQLISVWNSLSPANMPGAIVLGCGTIGTGGGGGAGLGCAGNTTLPAGVYISASGSTIDVTGDITLDGGGDSNALFVFQAPSALTASVNSRILLTNGAKASNVFWFVGSSANLLTGTEFNGNILASASITMGNLATSCGRLLAGAEGSGTFAFDMNVVSVPGHASAPAGCE